jgi:methyl-accepting chemotaxis protein
VKELAKETASATDEISKKLEKIQVDTRRSMKAIAEICEVIAQVDFISATIASAVEEQTATTSETTRSLAEGSVGSQEIARNMIAVTAAAKSTAQGAEATERAAALVASLARDLQRVSNV